MTIGLAIMGLMFYPLIGQDAWAPVFELFDGFQGTPGVLLFTLAAIPAMLLIIASLWDKSLEKPDGPTLLVETIQRRWTSIFAPTIIQPEPTDTVRATRKIESRVAPCPTQETLVLSAGITTVARPIE